jgi:hypothetical protein
VGSNPTPSASQSRVFSLWVLFRQKHCFCGRLRTSLTRAGTLFFYTFGKWLAFGQSFYVALTRSAVSSPHGAASISEILTLLSISSVTEAQRERCRDSVVVFGFKTTYKTAGTAKVPLSRTRSISLNLSDNCEGDDGWIAVT